MKPKNTEVVACNFGRGSYFEEWNYALGFYDTEKDHKCYALYIPYDTSISSFNATASHDSFIGLKPNGVIYGDYELDKVESYEVTFL